MASNLARAKLARAARGLNRGSQRFATLPPLLFLTDQERVPDAAAVARLLPEGSAIIVRHRNAKARAMLARALEPIAKAKALKLLVADDAPLAALLALDGVHVPEAHLTALSRARRHRGWLVTAAAHSERAALRAARAGADAVLLAPVFPTRSHPGKPALGPLRLRLIAARIGVPVFALGGINADNIGRLSGAKLAGVAAIDGLLAD